MRYRLECPVNRYVFKSRLNCSESTAGSLRQSGSEFQTVGPDTEKARNKVLSAVCTLELVIVFCALCTCVLNVHHVCMCVCVNVHPVDDGGHWGHGGLFTHISSLSQRPKQQYTLAGRMKGLSFDVFHFIIALTSLCKVIDWMTSSILRYCASVTVHFCILAVCRVMHTLSYS